MLSKFGDAEITQCMQDVSQRFVEGLHQRSARWMWFSLVRELWVRPFLGLMCSSPARLMAWRAWNRQDDVSFEISGSALEAFKILQGYWKPGSWWNTSVLNCLKQCSSLWCMQKHGKKIWELDILKSRSEFLAQQNCRSRSVSRLGSCWRSAMPGLQVLLPVTGFCCYKMMGMSACLATIHHDLTCWSPCLGQITIIDVVSTRLRSWCCACGRCLYLMTNPCWAFWRSWSPTGRWWCSSA